MASWQQDQASRRRGLPCMCGHRRSGRNCRDPQSLRMNCMLGFLTAIKQPEDPPFWGSAGPRRHVCGRVGTDTGAKKGDLQHRFVFFSHAARCQPRPWRRCPLGGLGQCSRTWFHNDFALADVDTVVYELHPCPFALLNSPRPARRAAKRLGLGSVGPCRLLLGRQMFLNRFRPAQRRGGNSAGGLNRVARRCGCCGGVGRDFRVTWGGCV